MTDVYLPLLPEASEPTGDFHLLGSSLVDTFRALGVPPHSTLRNLSVAAEAACGLGMDGLLALVKASESGGGFSESDDGYVPDDRLPDDVVDAEGGDERGGERGEDTGGAGLRSASGEILERLAERAAESDDERDAAQVCFKAALTIAMLNNGLNIDMDRRLFATDVITTRAGNQLKAGWTLGAILFEINSLPWTYKPDGAGGGAAELPIRPHPPIKVDAPAEGPTAPGAPAGWVQGGGSGKLQVGSPAAVEFSLGFILLGVSAAFALLLAAVTAGVARLRGAGGGEDEERKQTPLLGGTQELPRAQPAQAADGVRRPYEHLLPTGRRKRTTLDD